MLSLVQVLLAIFDTTMLNVTITSFSVNLLTPNTVSLHSHNLKTTTNLLVNQEDIYVPPCLHVQSCIQTAQFLMIVAALISYFVDKTKGALL